jgi:hypothetical protein
MRGKRRKARADSLDIDHRTMLEQAPTRFLVPDSLVSRQALSAAPAGETSVQPFASLGLSRAFVTPVGVRIVPSINLGYAYEAGDTGTSVALTAPGGAAFNSPYNNVGRSMGRLAAGVMVARGNWAVFAHYSAQLSGTGTLQMASFGVEGRF